MLSNEEKREMLGDAASETRREDFRRAREKYPRRDQRETLDEYIEFLDSVQEIFGPFEISTRPTITKANKL